MNRLRKRITLFQISNPQQSMLIRETTLESHYTDAHMNGHHVYLADSAQFDLDAYPDGSENIDIATIALPTSDNDIFLEAVPGI
ncbi:MAG: hypothetical protein KZQ78_09615 [Candidatus Thiodiazotropha sp. (ex Ustalcina ferruginea)]|nr:hypothetical protein [Candidatus Thiodiazotropha sp. (ex Ustalcina ferruginea)]